MTKNSGKTRWCVALLSCVVAAVGGGIGYAQAARPATAAATKPAVTAANAAEAEKHYEAAAALREQNKLQEAWVENQKALALNPSHPMATLLRKVLQEKLGTSETGGAAAGGGAGETEVAAGTKYKPLTPQQISNIRLAEMTNDDKAVRGRIERKTLQEFWDKVIKTGPDARPTEAEYNAFMNPNNFVEQVHRIRVEGHPEYLKQVTIISDPANMVAFRIKVHPYILASCATGECHGGGKAGALKLFQGNSDASLYSNFYLLSTYAVKGGGKLIDRQNPENSLILQYSLPPNVSLSPHKPAINARFGNTQVQLYKDIAAWIGTLAIPTPRYDVKLEPVTAPGK